MAVSVRAAIDLVEQQPVLRPAHGAEITNRPDLQVRVAGAGDVGDDFTRPRRAALAQHEQRVLLQLGGAVPGQQFFDHRHHAVRIVLHQTAQRQELDLLVILCVRRHRLTRGLANLDLQRLRILQPPAVGEALLQIRQRIERLGALALLVERVRLPVERRIDPGIAGHADEPVELLDGALEAALIDRLLGLAIDRLRLGLDLGWRRLGAAAAGRDRRQPGSPDRPRNRSRNGAEPKRWRLVPIPPPGAPIRESHPDRG